MADAGLSSLGVRLYAAISEDGSKVTEGSKYSELTRINAIGEMTLDANPIDASALSDFETKNVPGRSSVSDTYTITINVTNETLAEWDKIVGKKVCFMTTVPGLSKNNFVIATVPTKLPASGMDQNVLITAAINCTANEFLGWDTPVEISGE